MANITAPSFLTPPRRDSGRGRRAHQDDSPYQRRWSPGDVVQLVVKVLPQVVEANPRVADDSGRVAIQRGPLIYCLEEIDQPGGISLNDGGGESRIETGGTISEQIQE